MNWDLQPPPGFQGLRDDVALEVYQRHLPHWRQAGATYFLTFRLADSLPQNKLAELKAVRIEWERRHPPPRTNEQLDELWRESFRRIDYWLDEGMGSCCLKDDSAAREVADAVHYFDGERYELGCYVVMPNHVHVVVRPFDADKDALARITHSWKRYSARQLNLLLGMEGALWEDESYDRIIRDEEHLWRTIQYIGRNPRQANLTSCLLWIRPEWERLGWIFVE